MSVANLVPCTLSRSFLGFCLSMADLNMVHPQSFPSLLKSVWTILKHIFCSQLPSHTPAPTFHPFPLQFSPIYSRTWYLHIALLCWDTTSHTDYIQLDAVCLHCRSHAVHAVCQFSPCLWRTMLMHAHMHQVAIQIWHHSPNFLDVPCNVNVITQWLLIFSCK